MIFIVALLIIIICLFYYLLKPHNNKKFTSKTTKSPTISLQRAQATNTNTYPSDSTSLEPRNIIVPQALLDFRLISKEECKQKTIEEILAITQSLPRPHPMLRALTKEIEDSEKLYHLVKSDPEIAAKILQTVNSASFYLTQNITRLNHAIMYLGTNMVKNIALQCVINTQAQPSDKQMTHAFKKIWANGFLASSLAFIFGKNLGLSNAAELATQALLTYIGNLAIISYKPELAYYFSQSLSLFERVQIEQKELGIHSAIVGSELALTWQLPQEIVDGISHNLIPLGISVSHCTLPIDDLRNIVLCYLCCRAAELIIEHELHDIAEVNFLNPDSIELFYLPEYLRVTNMNDLFSLQHKPSFRNEVNKLMQKIEYSKH